MAIYHTSNIQNNNTDKLNFIGENCELTVGSNENNVAYVRVHGNNYNHQFVADLEKFKIETYDNNTKTWSSKLSIPFSANNILNTLGSYYSVSGSNVKIKSGEAISVASLTLPKGLYVIAGFVRFSKNASGERRANILNTADSNVMQESKTANANNSTQLNLINIIKVDNNQTTIHLNAFQNSGSELDIETGGTFIRAAKIG